MMRFSHRRCSLISYLHPKPSNAGYYFTMKLSDCIELVYKSVQKQYLTHYAPIIIGRWALPISKRQAT